uniref:Uncharacterized protein n=1 Tax=Hyaloperonospora arabidopsidis (strain Emoy2) TaxID=559515 RepID=M4BWB5_HYAAE
MGAALVCFGDKDTPVVCQMRQSSALSLLGRLQTSWSSERPKHVNNKNHDDDESINWDTFLVQSNKSTASSGRRMLSASYSRLLEETSDCAFYVDTQGKRLKGRYFDRIEVLDDYFVPFQPKHKRYCHVSPRIIEKALATDVASDDCFSTSSTITSESDYWTSALDPLLVNERRHMAPLQPVLGRCASLGPLMHARVKMHRARTSPQLQEDMYAAYSQSPWSSKHGKCSFPSPQRTTTVIAASAS